MSQVSTLIVALSADCRRVRDDS